MGLGDSDGGLGTSGAREGIALEALERIPIADASADTGSEAAAASSEGETEEDGILSCWPCPRATERFITTLSDAATLDASSGMDPSPAEGKKAPSS